MSFHNKQNDFQSLLDQLNLNGSAKTVGSSIPQDTKSDVEFVEGDVDTNASIQSIKKQEAKSIRAKADAARRIGEIEPIQANLSQQSLFNLGF